MEWEQSECLPGRGGGPGLRRRGLSFVRMADFDFATAKIREDVRKAYPERKANPREQRSDEST